ncbi:GNAT family N-acetyltransferase [Deinococcus irradiatisoli]|uniref:GNAT family N-acetyltransferase n=1 Tax=Deinococcus irradiatisoli TaxID=2202254 RepID=A0A2Z3JCT0_9DEIO|nr:GNAT family N-acetyltransferase [Deinococcus irradiatisoli]AWN22745.1 GNAT family N-acetyltransferase [Deinococcus irradiatisoli]
MRDYTPADRPACLILFESNRPQFFTEGERAEYSAFLDKVEAGGEAYFVLERGGEVLACGGVGLQRAPDLAYLSWGMVRGDRRGTGLGKELTRFRLDWLRAHWPEVRQVKIETSQHTEGFYARFGFEVAGRVPDGFGPGIDQVRMVAAL